MKKLIFALLCAVVTIGASAQDGKLTVNAGFLFPSTLNATVGYEHPLAYGNALEVFGEVGKPLAEARFLERLLLGRRHRVQAPPCPLQERNVALSLRAAVRGGGKEVLPRTGGRL